jgi:hypothetical protein
MSIPLPTPSQQFVGQPNQQFASQQGIPTQAPIQTQTSQLTQAPLVVQPVNPPGVVQRLAFATDTVKELSADDFNINSKEMITLKYDDCILVLFYVENTESHQLANIWALAAQQTAGPVFAAINMLQHKKVANAFTRLASDGSNPLHWASLRQYPFILVYRKRWPVAVYNGAREVGAIVDYAMTLACKAGYYEILQVGGSMQSESRIEMGPYQPYTNIPGQKPTERTESIQYTSEEPIRGFNPTIPVEVTGSAQAQQATGEIRAEEQQQQGAEAEGVAGSLTEDEEAAPTLTEPPPVTPAPPPVGDVAVPVSPNNQA